MAAVVSAAIAVGALGLPAGAGASSTPHLDYVAVALRHHAPGTEGKVWRITHGNTLPANWLLQTPNCWGELNCGQPPPGGRVFLDRITQMLSGAQISVDFAGLFPPPNGLFRQAIVNGLKQAIANGHRPTVRILIGTFPGNMFSRPAAYVSELSRELGGVLPIQAAYMSTYRERTLGGLVASSWDHSKILDADGRTAIVGGTNYFATDYLTTSHPVNDVSMQVSGPAAGDVSKFENLLWSWTCEHRRNPLYVYFAAHAVNGCLTHDHILPAPAGGGVPMMVVGRLGNGIEVPGEAGRQSPPISRPPVHGNKCVFYHRDYSQTNNDPAYEYRNPGEDALRALIGSGHHSIFISQQDLLSCLPHAAIATEARFDERVFAALGLKVAHRVPIKIVISGGTPPGYGNGRPIGELAKELTDMVAAQQRISYSAARGLVCRDVGLGYIHSARAATWPDGTRFYNHAKLVEVDDQAFYIGSENLYPARIQELGLITESPAATATLKTQYLDPLWSYSSPYALIDPTRGHCGHF